MSAPTAGLAADLDGAGVLWLTLDRPDVGNAISPDLRERLIDALGGASADLRVRAVVLRGAGRHFCTGADLRATHGGAPRPEGAPERPAGWVARTIATGAQRLVAAVLDCEKPVLASVQGVAAGIGAHLVLAADLVVAARSARLVEVFSRRGIVPDGGGAYLLTRCVGLHTAKEWVLFGDDVSATEAHRFGVVNRVVDDDELGEATAGWVERLAAGPTVALSWGKRLLNQAADGPRQAAFTLEAAAQEVVRASADATEGMTAFRDRRPSRFVGW